jgi:hypothetical protein
MWYAFFWVIPRRLNFICRGFGKLCLFHLRRRLDVEWLHFLNIVILHLSAYEDGKECFETSAYKIQTPGKYPEESIQHQLKIYSHVKYFSFAYEGCRTGLNWTPDFDGVQSSWNVTEIGVVIVRCFRQLQDTWWLKAAIQTTKNFRRNPNPHYLHKSLPIWHSIGYYLILTGTFTGTFLLPKPLVNGG